MNNIKTKQEQVYEAVEKHLFYSEDNPHDRLTLLTNKLKHVSEAIRLVTDTSTDPDGCVLALTDLQKFLCEVINADQYTSYVETIKG